MKRILTGIFFLISAGSIPLQAQHVIDDPVPISMPVAPARLSPDEILARADSLHRAYCFEDASHPRRSIKEVLEGFKGREVTVLIGPEGDFSPEEAALALENGYIPVHLGASRLRTETAAVTAAEAVYFHFM